MIVSMVMCQCPIPNGVLNVHCEAFACQCLPHMYSLVVGTWWDITVKMVLETTLYNEANWWIFGVFLRLKYFIKQKQFVRNVTGWLFNQS